MTREASESICVEEAQNVSGNARDGPSPNSGVPRRTTKGERGYGPSVEVESERQTTFT